MAAAEAIVITIQPIFHLHDHDARFHDCRRLFIHRKGLQDSQRLKTPRRLK